MFIDAWVRVYSWYNVVTGIYATEEIPLILPSCETRKVYGFINTFKNI